MKNWTQGYILCQPGNVTYNVSLQSSTWVQHANQLCSSKLEISTKQGLDLPLNILLDTFGLPRENVGTSKQNRNMEHRSRHQGMKTRKSVKV